MDGPTRIVSIPMAHYSIRSANAPRFVSRALTCKLIFTAISDWLDRQRTVVLHQSASEFDSFCHQWKAFWWRFHSLGLPHRWWSDQHDLVLQQCHRSTCLFQLHSNEWITFANELRQTCYQQWSPTTDPRGQCHLAWRQSSGSDVKRWRLSKYPLFPVNCPLRQLQGSCLQRSTRYHLCWKSHIELDRWFTMVSCGWLQNRSTASVEGRCGG